MIPTLPLRARNRLAELILAALRDEAARRELSALGRARSVPSEWLDVDEQHHGHALLTRAQRASQALAGHPLLSSEPSLDEVLEAARILFDAGLHFEVHELLEPRWLAARGTMREAIQGLIQVAVGYQHLANGNVAGARSLLQEGSARLRAAPIAALDVSAFVDGVRSSLERMEELDEKSVPKFPSTRRGERDPRPRGGPT